MKNCNHSKWIQSIRMQIQNIRMGFEAFESKFDPLVRDSKHSNANSNFQKRFKAFEPHSKHSNTNSNPSNEIRSIRMQIQNFPKGSEAFESKFKALERDSNHSNVNSNHSKEI